MESVAGDLAGAGGPGGRLWEFASSHAADGRDHRYRNRYTEPRGAIDNGTVSR